MRLTTRIALAGTLLLIGTGASVAQDMYVQPRQRTIVREYIQVDPYGQRTLVREREHIRRPSVERPAIYPDQVDSTPLPPRNIDMTEPGPRYLNDRPVVIEQRRVIVDPNDGHVMRVLE